MNAWLNTARKEFHSACLAGPISVTKSIPSIADVSSKASVEISSSLIAKIGKVQTRQAKLAGQTAGQRFENVCQEYIQKSMIKLHHMRPGKFSVQRGAAISQFEQYTHLDELRVLANSSKELRTHLGSDYLIKPDIVVLRSPETDDYINQNGLLVDEAVARQTPIRQINCQMPTLHASISCKLTIRSDRVQNTRSEALNLIRNRKGKLPHIAAITAEPLPSRIAAIALGTGDIDCVYHFALHELVSVLSEQGRETLELVQTMISGKRLRDISDLPLDLII